MDSGGLLRRFSHGWMTRLLFAAATRLLQVSAQEQDGHLCDGRLWRDVVLPQPWRMLGPIEGLTEILMCGLSTGLFFAIIARLIGPRFKAETQ